MAVFRRSKPLIVGGEGNDRIYSGTIYQEGQSVVLIGGAGDDWVETGVEECLIIEGSDSGNDTYLIFSLHATLDYSTAAAIFINLDQFKITELDSGSVDGLMPGLEKVTFIASDFDDTMIGSALGNTFVSGDGDDLFTSRYGDDTVNGGDGSDIVEFPFASTDCTMVETAQGTEITFVAEDGLITTAIIRDVEILRFTDIELSYPFNLPVTVTLTNAPETYVALSDNDHIIDARGGNDSITAAGGDDRILGGAGNDTLNGGAGHDTFRYTVLNSGTDAIHGGDGFDRIIAEVNGAVIRLSALSEVEEISAASGAVATLLGTNAAETFDLSATVLTNITAINMSGGADSVIGSDGSDYIIGGSGNDTMAGGDGQDQFEIGRSAGLDVIDGGEGYDQISGTGDGAQVYLPGLSNVEAIAGNGSTIVIGSTLGEQMDLSSMDVTGVALIDGRAGNDTMTGSISADRIMGNTGSDLLTGGLGSDQFVYTTTGHSRSTTVDTITDYEQGADLIDLSAVDANRLLAGVQDFVFLGVAAVAGLAGQIWCDATSFEGETRIYGDTNGDTRADMEIRLTGTFDLTALDFLV